MYLTLTLSHPYFLVYFYSLPSWHYLVNWTNTGSLRKWHPNASIHVFIFAHSALSILRKVQDILKIIVGKQQNMDEASFTSVNCCTFPSFNTWRGKNMQQIPTPYPLCLFLGPLLVCNNYCWFFFKAPPPGRSQHRKAYIYLFNRNTCLPYYKPTDLKIWKEKKKQTILSKRELPLSN